MKYNNSNNLSTQSKKQEGEKGKRYTRNWIQNFKIEFENIGVVPPNEMNEKRTRTHTAHKQTHAEINRLKQEWNLYDEVAWTNNNNTLEGLSAAEQEENRSQNIFKRQSMREDKNWRRERWEKWSQRNSFCCRCAHVFIFGRSDFLLIFFTLFCTTIQIISFAFFTPSLSFHRWSLFGSIFPLLLFDSYMKSWLKAFDYTKAYI